MPLESKAVGRMWEHRPSRVSRVKSCIFHSDKVFICTLWSNKHFEKSAESSISLPCALLKSKEHTCQCRQTQSCCWSPRVYFTYVSTVQLGPCSLVRVCQQWLFLSLVVVNPSSPPAQWCACPLCLICCCQYFLGTLTLGSSNSECLEWGVWCSWKPQGLCQPLAVLPKLFHWLGCP